MRIRNLLTYKDGGTVQIVTDEGLFWVDNRLGTKTKGRIYNSYPEFVKTIENEEEIKMLLLDELEKSKIMSPSLTLAIELLSPLTE